jgi:hypothetical protein
MTGLLWPYRLNTSSSLVVVGLDLTTAGAVVRVVTVQITHLLPQFLLLKVLVAVGQLNLLSLSQLARLTRSR